jgi:hypothetical protein
MATNTDKPTNSPWKTRKSAKQSQAKANVPREPQSSTGKPQTPSATNARCKLCDRRFDSFHALRMHMKTSSLHQTSSQASHPPSGAIDLASTALTTTGQGQAPGGAISSPPGHRKTTAAVGCDLCGRLFDTEKALAMHIQYSKQHSQSASAVSSGPDSRKDARDRSSRAQTNSSHISPRSIKKTPDSQHQVWCHACRRQFRTESGLQNHVQNSVEHKANVLGQLAVQSTTGIDHDTDTAAVASELNSQAPTAASNNQISSTATESSVNITLASKATTDQMINRIDSASQIRRGSTRVSQTRQSLTTTERDRVVAGQECDTSLASDQGWSEIPTPVQQTVLELLREKCHPVEHLSRNAYRVERLTPDQMDGYRKCKECGGMAILIVLFLSPLFFLLFVWTRNIQMLTIAISHEEKD